MADVPVHPPTAPAAGPPWAERDAAARRATLDGLLAQISREALQGDGLDAVLQGIVDALVRALPVAIASILITDDAGALFVKEVWAGEIGLHGLAGAIDAEPWPVTVGAAGRCCCTTCTPIPTTCPAIATCVRNTWCRSTTAATCSAC